MMSDLTALRATNIYRRLLSSALGSIGLVCIYYYFFWEQGHQILGPWIGSIFIGHIVMALVRFFLWYKRFEISKLYLTKIFPIIVTLNAGAWSLLIISLTIDFILSDFKQHTDIQVIHIFVLLGLLISLVQNLKYYFELFCINIVLISLTVSIALIPLVQTAEGLSVSYACLLITVITILVQNRKDWRNEKNLLFKELEIQNIIDCFPGGVCEIQGAKYQRVNQYFSETILKSTFSQVKNSNLKSTRVEQSWQSHFYEFEKSELRQKAFEETIETEFGPKTHLFGLSKTQYQTVILIAIDIEELVEAKTVALRQTKLALDKSRLATLGMMSAGIAHEISNPLALIGMIAETSAANFNNILLNPDQTKSKFQKIAMTVNRVNKVITSLKNMARSHEGSPEELVTLQEIIDDTIELTSDRLKSNGVELHLDCHCLDMQIQCRPTEICQVLINAINNSVHAVEELTERWIRLKIYLTPDNLLQLEISDSGKGIPEAVRGRITEPLFTTKSYGKGTGLGLSLSNEIMKNHGGQLFFDFHRSNTTLVLQLPLKFC